MVWQGGRIVTVRLAGLQSSPIVLPAEAWLRGGPGSRGRGRAYAPCAAGVGEVEGMLQPAVTGAL